MTRPFMANIEMGVGLVEVAALQVLDPGRAPTFKEHAGGKRPGANGEIVRVPVVHVYKSFSRPGTAPRVDIERG